MTDRSYRRLDRFQSPFITSLAQVLFSLLIVGLSTAILVLLRQVLSFTVVSMLFFVPVGLSTALWGLVPGILSALCAFLALNYFFVNPYYSFMVHHPQDLLVLVIFFVVAVVINQLVGRIRISLERATDREQETAWLYELSNSLAGLSDSRAIARTLAERVMAIFQPKVVQINLEGAGEIGPFLIRLPANSLPEGKYACIEPLQTARRLWGELGLWRDGHPLSVSKEQLLHTFASQGALAVERAYLAQAEQRAKLLEDSDRLKSTLLSSVSHELRTPLATIKASVTSLRSKTVEWDSEARQELLEAIDEETDHLNHLVGNLLDMTRIEAGAIQPQRKWNVLAEIVHSAIERLSNVSQHHQIVPEVSDELPLVPVEYIQMERVFVNLISNSIKYSPEQTAIRIVAKVQDKQMMRVQVSNQGPHVPEEHLERIFDKFYRITDADRVTGTGLGLSICKAFVEAHGGRIWAENLPDGFTINFTIPLTWRGMPPRMPVEE